jgi:hypothetical protein
LADRKFLEREGAANAQLRTQRLAKEATEREADRQPNSKRREVVF